VWSTTFPQPHVCGSHALQPSLKATDIRSCSSDSRRPSGVIGGVAIISFLPLVV